MSLDSSLILAHRHQAVPDTLQRIRCSENHYYNISPPYWAGSMVLSSYSHSLSLFSSLEIHTLQSLSMESLVYSPLCHPLKPASQSIMCVCVSMCVSMCGWTCPNMCMCMCMSMYVCVLIGISPQSSPLKPPLHPIHIIYSNAFLVHHQALKSGLK